nr:extracellular solute-binding protein [Chloroflexia bacterium]
YTNNVGLYYNRGMFSAAGLDGPPTTWDELVEFGQALTDGDSYGMMMGASGMGAFVFWPFAFQNGATLISDDGMTAEFGSPEGLEAWNFYSDLYLTHGIVPADIKSATTAWDQTFAPFIQERAAMVMSGDWATGAIVAGNPEIDFAVAPLPVGREAATVIGGYNLAIPPTSPNADAAWDFIAWLTAEEQAWILQEYSRIQARADIVDTEYATRDPLIQVFIEQSAVGRARATVPAWTEIEATIVANAWDSVILEQASPDDALATAVEQANELLADQ